MTDRLPRPLSGVAVLAACLAGLAGCSGTPDAVDDRGFAECAQQAGAPVGDAGEWSDTRWREQMADPDVLRCALIELEDDERGDLLERAFPVEDRDSDVGAAPRLQALVDYARTTAASDEDRAIEGTVDLIRSLDWWEDGQEAAVRRTATATLLGSGAITDFEAFAAEEGLDPADQDTYNEYAASATGAAGALVSERERLMFDLVRGS